MARSLRPRQIVRQGENVAQRQQRFLSHHIAPVWHRQAAGPTPSRGLSNHGNRCYRNSVLQVLFHTPKVVNWLEGHDPNCPVPNCVICSLSKLCLRSWDVPLNQVQVDASIRDLDLKVRRSYNFRSIHWSRTNQQHVGEFFLILLQSMTRRDPRAAQILQGIFGFEIITRSICLDCAVPNNFNHPLQYSLRLALPQPTTPTPVALTHLLSNGTNGHLDHISTVRHCRACFQPAENMQYPRFATAPEVLVLELKRFTQVNGAWRKNSSPVSFTQDLDLSSFVDDTATLKYRLIAVVHQQGGLNLGRYKVVAKTPGGRWEEIQDMVVRKVRVGAALDPVAPWMPFVLVYTRVEGQVGVRR